MRTRVALWLLLLLLPAGLCLGLDNDLEPGRIAMPIGLFYYHPEKLGEPLPGWGASGF